MECLGASVHALCRLCGEAQEVSAAKILLHVEKEGTLKARSTHKLAQMVSLDASFRF